MTTGFKLSAKNKERLWVVYFAVLFFWGLQAFIFLGKLHQNGELFAQVIDKKPYVSDFVNVYSAGVLCQRNMQKPIDIYDANVQANLQKELLAPIVPEDPFYNQYPPVMFLLFYPLSFFTMQGAWIAWAVFSFALISIAICQTVLPLYNSRIKKLIAYTAIMASYPTWLSFRLGQTSLLLMPVMMYFFYLLQKKRYFWSGLVSSLVLLKLQYLPTTVAIGFAMGRLPYLLGFVSGATALSLASLLALGWQNFLAFPQAILSGESGAKGSGVAPEMMQNLRGVMVLFAGADTRVVHIAAAALGLIAIISIFVVWLRFKRNEKITNDEPAIRDGRYFMLIALTLFLMLITSVHTHTQDYVLAVVASSMCFYVTYERHLPQSMADSPLSKWTLRLALAFPVVSWLCFFAMPFLQLLKIQTFAFYAMVQTILVSLLIFKTRRQSVK